MIVGKLGVPKATLSGWLAKLKLKPEVQEKILQRKRENLIVIRKKACAVNKRNRDAHLFEIKSKCVRMVNDFKIDAHQKTMLLAGLFMGEGFKNLSSVGFGNSNAEILCVYLSLLRSLYQLNDAKLRCFLHLRADQNDAAEKRYWSKKLGIPLEKFRKTEFDQRTIGKKTRIGYHGVCTLRYYDASIAKKIHFTAQAITDRLLGS